MRRCSALIVLIFTVIIASPAVYSQQDHLLSVNAIPYGTLPLGTSGDFFNLGFGTEGSVSFIPGFLRYFGLAGRG
jgi:hypothetical protein